MHHSQCALNYDETQISIRLFDDDGTADILVSTFRTRDSRRQADAWYRGKLGTELEREEGQMFGRGREGVGNLPRGCRLGARRRVATQTRRSSDHRVQFPEEVCSFSQVPDALLEIVEFVERKGLRADKRFLSTYPISLISFRDFVRQQMAQAAAGAQVAFFGDDWDINGWRGGWC